MILVDTSGLLAAIDSAQPAHRAAAAALAGDAGPFPLSPFVLAELDYLLGRRVGMSAQKALLEDVGAGAYRLEPFSPADVRRAEWRRLVAAMRNRQELRGRPPVVLPPCDPTAGSRRRSADYAVAA